MRICCMLVLFFFFFFFCFFQQKGGEKGEKNFGMRITQGGREGGEFLVSPVTVRIVAVVVIACAAVSGTTSAACFLLRLLPFLPLDLVWYQLFVLVAVAASCCRWSTVMFCFSTLWRRTRPLLHSSLPALVTTDGSQSHCKRRETHTHSVVPKSLAPSPSPSPSLNGQGRMRIYMHVRQLVKSLNVKAN